MINISEILCKGCGYCVKFCPKNILTMGNERNDKGYFFPVVTDAAQCTSCAICATMCPEAAIEVPAKEEQN